MYYKHALFWYFNVDFYVLNCIYLLVCDIGWYVSVFRLGEFDPPEMVPFNTITPDVIQSEKHRAIALKAASMSFVLLKNNNKLLPLDKSQKVKTVAVSETSDHSNPKTKFGTHFVDQFWYHFMKLYKILPILVRFILFGYWCWLHDTWTCKWFLSNWSINDYKRKFIKLHTFHINNRKQCFQAWISLIYNINVNASNLEWGSSRINFGRAFIWIMCNNIY